MCQITTLLPVKSHFRAIKRQLNYFAHVMLVAAFSIVAIQGMEPL